MSLVTLPRSLFGVDQWLGGSQAIPRNLEALTPARFMGAQSRVAAAWNRLLALQAPQAACLGLAAIAPPGRLGQNRDHRLSRRSSVLPVLRPARIVKLRRAYWLAAFLIVVLLVAAVAPVREGLLRAAGNMLVREDPPIHAEVIVISVDSGGAGVLEASDLMRERLAPGVAIFADPPVAVDREFLRRGLPYHDAAAQEMQELHELGVTSVVRIPRVVRGTHDEMAALRGWCQAHAIHSLMFVSTRDHTRRTRRMLHRAMDNRAIRFAVIGSKYSDFNPDGWWSNRGGLRIEIVESQKLLLDVLLHPLS